MGGHSHGHVMSDGSIGPSGRHGLLSLGLDLGMASTPIWEYPRCEALLAYLRSQMEAEPALEVDDVDVAPRRTFGGGWMDGVDGVDGVDDTNIFKNDSRYSGDSGIRTPRF